MFSDVGCINSCTDDWTFYVCANKQYSAPVANDCELAFASYTDRE